MSVEDLTRRTSWDGVRAVVIGIGVSGFAAADNLTHLGAQVTVLAESADDVQREKADLLQMLGATVRIGTGETSELPDDIDVVVTSPGVPPTSPLIVAAGARGVPVWGEVELAWRLRDPDHPGAWLCVTGTNGKTTTVQMLDGILKAAGLSSIACGNVGLPIVEAVMDPEPYAVYAVELSSFQLHYTSSMSAHAAAVLNVAEDHLDWYSSEDGEYAADKGRIYHQVQLACIYNVADPVTEQLVRDADVVEGARAVGFTLGTPAVGMVGLVEDVLADRAFIDERASSAAELCTLADLASAAPHFAANALAAAALARRSACPRPRCGTACAASSPTATGSRRWRPSRTSATSTTPRPPTRTRPCRRCRRTTVWSGSREGWPRARRSTTWSRASATGCGAWCCSAGTARSSPRRFRDTPPMSR